MNADALEETFSKCFTSPFSRRLPKMKRVCILFVNVQPQTLKHSGIVLNRVPRFETSNKTDVKKFTGSLKFVQGTKWKPF